MGAENGVRHITPVARRIRLPWDRIRELLVVRPRFQYQECPGGPGRRRRHRKRRGANLVDLDAGLTPEFDLV